ncbi:MAG TPA: cobalamin-binding protein [Bryobacteraceae bacterium]|nr:cobalamin-binding protein [Bryobacteraceae bacterium]
MAYRILSLLASATEIVHALDLGRFQVGRSHECDFPEEVSRLPICSRPSFRVDGSSAEIDALVKDRLRTAVSIYDLDSHLIRQLAPTHIVTQTQCEVCAVSLNDVERAVRAELDVDCRVIALEPHALSGLWRDIGLVAAACDCEATGAALIRRLQLRMNDIMDAASESTWCPRVAAIEWLEPLMAGGNWVPELIAMAGGENLFGHAGRHSPWMEWDELAAADPDIIVALPCGFDLERTRQEMHWLAQRPGWPRLQAVRQKRVFLCDGNQYMNRPGPRLVESLRIFAEIFHPERFAPTMEGAGWVRFPGDR